ncbi:hypothetical protein GCM10028803_61210 [Larkinella knui]|uniref:DUF4369 domain-containing protein n=1 Tax=Larkinella knui TaxID=2025310 RepID=A0A3P1CB15_9BACT|nr:DUF4369 domain-containing protein [Larkinella knui]RRB10455.1 DUF4369 domain-containing protein [Larkinella knui]
MKNKFFILVLLISFGFLTSVQAQKNVRLQGNVSGLGTVMVYLKKTDNANSRPVIVDSTRAVDGKFTFSRSIPEIDFYNVVAAGLPGQVQFIWDGDLTLEGTRDAFRESEIKGSPLTDSWLKFQNEVDRPYRNVLMDLYNDRQRSTGDTAIANRVAREEKRLKAEQNQKVAAHIKANPDSQLSLYLLNWYWNQFPKTEARAMYDKLSSSFKSHTLAKRLQNQLK